MLSVHILTVIVAVATVTVNVQMAMVAVAMFIVNVLAVTVEISSLSVNLLTTIVTTVVTPLIVYPKLSVHVNNKCCICNAYYSRLTINVATATLSVTAADDMCDPNAFVHHVILIKN